MISPILVYICSQSTAEICSQFWYWPDGFKSIHIWFRSSSAYIILVEDSDKLNIITKIHNKNKNESIHSMCLGTEHELNLNLIINILNIIAYSKVHILIHSHWIWNSFYQSFDNTGFSTIGVSVEKTNYYIFIYLFIMVIK